MALLAPRDDLAQLEVGSTQSERHSNQNTSSAVMAQRIEPANSADLFPTPPWATRALVEWISSQDVRVWEQSVWEPAAGLGHMSNTLAEFFNTTEASDAYPYGHHHWLWDFIADDHRTDQRWVADWIITNPPFKLAEEFCRIAIRRANIGVAMLVRTTFLEGVGRHRDLFSITPPTYVLQFTERVPMHRGRLEERGSTATSYCWLVWIKSDNSQETKLRWLPPCRKRLERPEDYRGAI